LSAAAQPNGRPSGVEWANERKRRWLWSPIAELSVRVSAKAQIEKRIAVFLPPDTCREINNFGTAPLGPKSRHFSGAVQLSLAEQFINTRRLLRSNLGLASSTASGRVIPSPDNRLTGHWEWRQYSALDYMPPAPMACNLFLSSKTSFTAQDFDQHQL